MIKVHIFNKKIIITGHADFADYGKDIVCASVSSIVITSVNASLRIDKNSIIYKEAKDKLTLDINSDNKNILLIIENMLEMLKELALTYKKNIKIIEEERP
ncbi:MAG: ribosomal-processing cysteine protease Prp [Ruminococcus sp.]|nr:ribosomal-processing cysteine protease Prp [Ruminococcus sp.]